MVSLSGSGQQEKGLIVRLRDSHLDDGVRINMKPGDVCVQRGTIHGWTNYADRPARVYFILTGRRLIVDVKVKLRDMFKYVTHVAQLPSL